MDILELKKIFTETYGEGEIRTFHSPGRINLIGEHIDYNGGYVFPCALDFGTYGLVRKRADNKINFLTTNFALKVTIDLEKIEYKKEDDWANYPKGVIQLMQSEGYEVQGMDILVSGNIPNGAGLSSSASLELLTAVIVNEMFNEGKINRIKLIKISQKAENEFVGVNCGIMDQFAIGMGKRNKAIMLDCNSLESKYADVNLENYTIVIMNTNKRRELNESKYNERRAECEEALGVLREVKDIQLLCELTVEEYENFKEMLKNPKIKNRVEHVIYENERVKQAYQCLMEGKIGQFGQLLIQSHNSLKDLYEVTGRELDCIVEEALKVEGCIGARMTGAGFGGCAIAIVEKNRIEEFKEVVRKNYLGKIGYEPTFYFSGIGEGTMEIKKDLL